MMVDMVFSINTGRSGSHYLHTLFRHAVGCEAYHEPPPNMQGIPLVDWNMGKEEAMRTAFKRKRQKIDAALSKGHVYVETNNAFIKGFGELVAEAYHHPRIGVVVLTRDKAKIVDSLLGCGYYRAYHPPGEWLLRPWHVTALVEYSEFYKTEAAWYVDEVYARGLMFMEMHPDIHYYTIDVGQLNDYDQVVDMLEFFNLTPMDSLKGAVAKPTNTR